MPPFDLKFLITQLGFYQFSSLLLFPFSQLISLVFFFIRLKHKQMHDTSKEFNFFDISLYLSLALFACRLSLSLWALTAGSSSSSPSLEQLRDILLVIKLCKFPMKKDSIIKSIETNNQNECEKQMEMKNGWTTIKVERENTIVSLIDGKRK